MNLLRIMGVALFVFCVSIRASLGQETAFWYQGQLDDMGKPANGLYDLQCSLYDSLTNGDLIAGPVIVSGNSVTNGLVQAAIDFGQVFKGTNLWLAIGVRTNSANGAFTDLTPRQALLPVPYAEFATASGGLTGDLSASQLTGFIPTTAISGIYPSLVTFSNSGDSFAGDFFGNGAGVTNLNATQVSSGTLADQRLSSNVPLLNGTQSFSGSNYFSGANIFTNRANGFVGSFYGNGLVGWIPVSETSTQAIPDAGYMLLSSSLTTLTLPATNQLYLGDVVRVAGEGTGGWLVQQQANESIFGHFLTASNNSWLPSSAASLGWDTIACSSDGTRWVAGATGGGGISTSTDGGVTWAVSGSFPSQPSPTCVASSDSGNTLTAVVYGQGILYSTNSGGTWYSGAAPSPANWECVASSANGVNQAAVIYGGLIYVSSNSGVSWTAETGATTENWASIASSADGSHLAAVVYGGKAWTSSNGGSTWTQQTSSPTGNWISVASSSDGSKLVMVNSSGTVELSNNGGVSWRTATGLPSSSWYHVACSADANTIYLVANGGGIYASANNGLTWFAEPVPSEHWTSIACSADGSVADAAYENTTTTGGIYRSMVKAQTASTTTSTSGYLSGGQGDAVELQYIGNGQFMALTVTGSVWAN